MRNYSSGMLMTSVANAQGINFMLNHMQARALITLSIDITRESTNFCVAISEIFFYHYKVILVQYLFK